jgi:hypothetical protein
MKCYAAGKVSVSGLPEALEYVSEGYFGVAYRDVGYSTPYK